MNQCILCNGSNTVIQAGYLKIKETFLSEQSSEAVTVNLNPMDNLRVLWLMNKAR